MLNARDLLLGVSGLSLIAAATWRSRQADPPVREMISTPDATTWVVSLVAARDSFFAYSLEEAPTASDANWIVLLTDFGCAYCAGAITVMDSLASSHPSLHTAIVVLPRFVTDTAAMVKNKTARCAQRDRRFARFLLSAKAELASPRGSGETTTHQSDVASLTADLQDCVASTETHRAMVAIRGFAERLFVPGTPFFVGPGGYYFGIPPYDSLVVVAGLRTLRRVPR